MKKTMHRYLVFLILLASISACATRPPAAVQYDFGNLNDTQTAKLMPPISIADARVPTWLDGTQIAYRLSYANEQQTASYANHRWTMPPGELFVARLKARIAQAGGTVLPAANAAPNSFVLHIEMDDFSQVFETPDRSMGQAAVRASVFQGRTLISQKTFVRRIAAPSADAAGGAHALAQASDAMIGDMVVWLATLSPTAK